MRGVRTLCSASLALSLLAAPLCAAGNNQSQGADGGDNGLLPLGTFGGLSLAAGPTFGDGIGLGVSLKGSNQKMWGPWNELTRFDVAPTLGYESNSNWNSYSGSRDQVSLELKPGVIVGILDVPTATSGGTTTGQVSDGQAPGGTSGDSGSSTITTNGSIQSGALPPPGPQSSFVVGLYGDLKYRYGTFAEAKKSSHVNQLLGGGGAYVAWAKNQLPPWVAFWPRLSATYYAPIYTTSPITNADLPSGVRVNYFQLQAEAGVNFGQGMFGSASDQYPFRLTLSYKGSAPTAGNDTAWENMLDVQLSTNLLGETFKPAITFQTGRNGGLEYDRQVLIGLVHDFL